mgnify:CR=1 FL=1
MTKKTKILLVLFVAALLLSLYLIATSEKVSKNKSGNLSGNEKGEKVDLVKLENDYKEGAKEAMAGYSRLIQGSAANAGQIEQLKNNLLALKVPAKFKDLHIDLVLAFDKIGKFLETNDEGEKIASQQMINRIKANYVWLN